MASFFREPPPQKTGATQPGQDWLSRFSAFVYSLFPVSIANGGTGQTTPQRAINALTQVGAATSGYVLTKDPANGNADWQPGGGGSGLVNSVTSTDVAITIAPTTGSVLVHGNNMVGDSGAGGTHGLVPAPSAGDAAANKFLKADATWSVAGSGTVTSVGLALPGEFTVSGSPVNTSGTLTAVWASETQHFVLAAPSGSSGTPSFRALVSGDIPALPYSLSPLTTKGDVWGFSSVDARIPVGTNAQVLTADSTQTIGVKWATPTTGTVTSVSLTMPAEFSVGGSPITSSGTLAVTKANETANTVWAGPTSGGAAAPAFRALVTADMPAGTGTVTSVATTAPITGGTITTTGTIGVTDFVASGVSHARGTVPDPGASSGTTKYLREDATWDVPPGTVANSTLQGQEFTTPGANTFNVPANVTSVWVTMIGGGGGGSNRALAANGGGGGGAGELVQNLQVKVTSSGTVTVTIGAKGTGGITGQAAAQPGVAGGDTSFGSTFFARGGAGATTVSVGGAGGGIGGGTGGATGAPGSAGSRGSGEAPTYFGGSAGGGGGNTTAAAGGAGAGSGGYTGATGGSVASSQAGGGGGASTIWGLGGAGGAGGGTGTSAASTSYGSGGGGAGGHATTTVAAGDGAPGYCLVQWIA